jgi:hypothetical protein
MIPLGILSAAGAGGLPTKIFLTAQVTAENNGVYLPPFSTSVSPNSTYFFASVSPPYTIHQVILIATLTYGLDEDYYSNPVVGQSVYFNIGGSIIGTSSLESGSASTMTTDSNGQISKTFTGGEWTTSFNGDYIQAFFDGNLEGTILASESGTMNVTEYGAA